MRAAESPSLLRVMPDVVKGLATKPPLLFGVGAGIVLVVVLGVTADVWLVLIVAVVLVLALVAWLISESRSERDRLRVQNVVEGSGARIRNSEVGTVRGEATSVNNRTVVENAHISGSTVGSVGVGTSRRRRQRRG